MSDPIVPRNPEADTRTRRFEAAVQVILNALVRRGDIVRGPSANDWRLAPLANEDLPGGSAPPVWFGDESVEGPMGPPGPQGIQGPQGEQGPAGSGGGASGYYPGWIEEPEAPFFLPAGGSGSSGSGVVSSQVGWEYHADQAADEEVEDSSTLVDSSYLQVGVTAGIYEFVLVVLYSGNATNADFKFDLAVTAGNLNGFFRNVGDNTSADGILDQQIRVTAGTSWAAPISGGTDASDTIRYVRVWGIHTFSADCTVKLRHAMVTAGVGKITKLRSGSYLRLRKVR